MKRIMSIAIASVIAVCCPLFALAESAGALVTPNDRLLTLLEAQLPWDDFQDMNSGTLSAAVSELGGIADAYTFFGRESASGEYGYIIGSLAKDKSPFDDLSSWFIWDENDRQTERFIFNETGENAFDITGVSVLRGLTADIIIVIPEYFAPFDAGALYARVLNGDFNYIEDARARGVKLLKPQTPYLCVQIYENGEYRKEYIPLNKTQVNFSKVDARAPYPPAVIGEYAIYMVEDERAANEARYSNASVPAYFVELAREKCGFQVASPGDIGEVISATMTLGAKARSQTITDPDALNEIRAIFKSAWYAGLSGCPYAGVLTLTMADGNELVIHKAVDSCPTLIFGSYAGYEISKAANERLLEIFSEALSPDEPGDGRSG